MIDSELVVALAAVSGGLLVGVLAGRTARRVLSGQTAHPALVEVASPTGIFLFWIATASGLILAVAAISPQTLEPLPSQILHWLPNVLVAGLFIIVGYAAAVTVAAAFGRTAARASGQRQPILERLVRVAILAGAVVLALGQLGVETAILNIIVAAVAFGVATATAGVTIVGARPIAVNIAAGRALTAVLGAGDRVAFETETRIDGVVAEIGNTHTTIHLDGGGGRTIVPNSLLNDSVLTVVGSDDKGVVERDLFGPLGSDPE